jgi:DNA-directed RNA polymerase subunit RPC12/RpoP
VTDNEVTIGVPMPLDSDGFLRRECPTCEREFKWLHTSEAEADSEPVADGGYFCPYCGVQAPSNAWLTQAQVALAQNVVATEVVGPMVKKFADDMKRTSRRSHGMVSASVHHDEPERLDPLTESDDMTRVDFECHPAEPVKIVDDWEKPVRCLVCGEPAS